MLNKFIAQISAFNFATGLSIGETALAEIQDFPSVPAKEWESDPDICRSWVSYQDWALKDLCDAEAETKSGWRNTHNIDELKAYAIVNNLDGFAVFTETSSQDWHDDIFYKKCQKVQENDALVNALINTPGVKQYLYEEHPCQDQDYNLELVRQECEADRYACLKQYRQSPYMQSTLDQRAFASLFEQYRHDKNNFQLFIWGYAMNMIDFYKERNMLLSSEEVDNPGDVQVWQSWTYFGEPNVFPQFGMATIIGLSEEEVRGYYESTQAGAPMAQGSFFHVNKTSTNPPSTFCDEQYCLTGECNYQVQTYQADGKTTGITQFIPRPNKNESFDLRIEPPLYDEMCEPLAALDGPWNEHSFVVSGQFSPW